jgi:DNA-directed RNA polymerase subunit RPC12/RpoP
MSYDTSIAIWNCPKCSSDLESLAEGRFVRCPECGNKWSVEWMRERPDVPLPRLRWVLMPLTSLAITLGVAAGELLSGKHPAWIWGVAWGLVWTWNVVCWTKALDRSARPRLGDMAMVIAFLLAAGPAALWTIMCVELGKALQG